MLLGTGAALGGLLAAVAAGAIVESERSEPERGPAEVELRFEAEDSEPSGLVAEDPSGETLPDVDFTRLDGTPANFTEYAGRPLVLNFFASWCPPCIGEMPDFESVHQSFEGEVAFLGMSLQDPVAATEDLIAQTGVTYDIGRDPSGALFEALGGLNMPATFFVSAEGVIVESRAGSLSADELRESVEQLLA